MIVGKSGEYTIPCGGAEHLYLTVCWEEQPDAAANTSVLAVTKLIVDGGGRLGRIYIGGSIAVNGSIIARLSEESNWAEIGGMHVPAEEENGGYPFVSAPIVHGADGKGTAVLSVQLSGVYPDAGQRFYAVAEIPVVLTDLSRLFVTVDGEAEIGAPVTIAVSSMHKDYTASLRYVCGGLSGLIGEDLAVGSHVWTPPMELCAAITDGLSGVCMLFCEGTRGSVKETVQTAVRLRIPEEVGITINSGWLSLQADNSGTAAEGMDCFVAGMSRVRGVFDDSRLSYDNAYGAEIVSRCLSVDGAVYDAPYLSDVLLRAGMVTVGCIAEDSRGVQYRTEEIGTVYAYGQPKILSAEVFRCTGSGAASNTGDCVSVTVHGSHSDLGGRNAAVITARLRSVDGAWGEAVTLTDGNAAVLWAGQLSEQKSYEAELRMTDSLGGIGTLTVTLPTADVFFHGRSGGKGAAFGKYAEADDLLELAWSLKTKGDLTVEGTAVIGGKTLTDWLYPVGAVCTCGADVDPAAVFGGTWILAGDSIQRYLRTE